MRFLAAFLLGFLWLFPASAVIAIDPNASSHPINATGSSTTTAVTLSTTNAGDCIIVIVTSGGGTGATHTLADTAGSTWTARSGSPYDPGSTGYNTSEWSTAVSGTLSSDVITATQTGTAFTAIQAVAISGCSSSGTSVNFDGNITTPPSALADSVNITTTNANDMIFGFCNAGNTSNATPVAGFTDLTGAPGDYLGNAYKVVSATQTALPVGWSNTPVCHETVVDAVKASGSVAAVPLRTLMGVGQ